MKNYLDTVGYQVSCLINAVIGGEGNTSVSYRIGQSNNPIAVWICKHDRGHCLRAAKR